MITVVLTVFLPLEASAIGIEGALGIWNMKQQGDMSYNGPDLNLEEDLQLGYDTAVFGRIKADMPLLIPNIYFMFTREKNEGTGTKAEDFVFGDRTFSKNAPFSSKLELNTYDLALYYGIPFLKTATLGKLNVDAGLNIKLVDLDVVLTQNNVSESKEYTTPVPMVFLAVQFTPVKRLAIEAELRAISLGSADHYYDLLGRLKYMVIGPAFLCAGYRHEDVKMDRKSLRLNRRAGGPFFEIGVAF